MHFAVNAHLLSPAGSYRQAGVSVYIHRILQQLPIVAPDDRWTIYVPPGAAHLLPDRPNVEVRTSTLPTGRPIVRILWEQFVAPVALSADRPDALLCPLNVVPLLTRVPAVVTVHDLAFLRYPEQRGIAQRQYLTIMTRASVRRAARVLTVSAWTRKEVMALLGAPPNKIVITPNGREEDLGPRDPDEVERFRQDHGLPPRFLLFLGTLEPRKNLTTLLRAYALVRGTIRMPLVVAGAKGWFYDPIFNLVDELGLGEDVHFAGYVAREEFALWYNAATAFVYPSLYEGFGLPPLEALRCGTPVVTSNTASLPEVVGDAAMLVDPTNVDALGAALVRITGDEQLRAELRRRGPIQARKFSWTTTANATVAALRAAASGSNGA